MSRQVRPRGRRPLSVRLVWHLSYAALLSVPILIFLLVSWATSRALEDQLEQSSATLVELMGKEIDGKLEDVSRLINDITWDPLASSLMNLAELSDGARRFDMVVLADRLTLAAGYSRFSDFVFVAFPNLQSVLIPTSHYAQEQFYRSYFAGTGVSREGLQDLLSRRHDGDSTALVYLDTLGRSQKAVAILKSLPPSPSSPAAANIGVLINVDTIVASLHSTIKASRSEIRILNDEGQVIVTTLTQPWTDQVTAKASVRINGESYTILQRQTQQFAWTVQLLVPDSIIKGNLLFAQLVILAGLALCLILGFLLTVYLVRRNYGPLSGILESLSVFSPQASGPEGDEFTQMRRSVTLVRNRLELTKEPLRQSLASGLLRARAATILSLDEALSALGVVFLTQEFVVYLVQFEQPPEPALVEDLHRELETCFAGLGTLLRSSDDQPLTFLINLNTPATPQTIPELQEAVAMWAQNLRERPGYAESQFASAFSSVVTGIAAIPTAWNRAKTALEYRFVVGGAAPFAWDQLKLDDAATLYHYDTEREGRLMTVIKAGDADAAAEILSQVFAENSRSGRRLSPLAAQCLVWDLVGTMMKALAEVSEGDESFTALFTPISALAQNPQWDARSGLLALVRAACAHAQSLSLRHQSQLKSSANHQFIQKVSGFLRAQFRDPSLDLTKIADAHGLTPAYLSRLFRENAEEGILDHLHRLRIEHAKTLLRENDKNLQEIGQTCGFIDVKTFIRHFRRFTGVTPGKYRETAK